MGGTRAADRVNKQSIIVALYRRAFKVLRSAVKEGEPLSAKASEGTPLAFGDL